MGRANLELVWSGDDRALAIRDHLLPLVRGRGILERQRGTVRLVSLRIGAWAVEHWTPFNELDPGEEVGILHHQDLGIEDPRLLGPGPLQDVGPELAQLPDHRRHGVPQAGEFRVHLARPDGAVGHVGEVEPHDHRGREGRPGRDADAAQAPLGHSSSKITKEHYIQPDEAVDPVTAEILEALAPRDEGKI